LPANWDTAVLEHRTPWHATGDIFLDQLIVLGVTSHGYWQTLPAHNVFYALLNFEWNVPRNSEPPVVVS
jgi:hypothetical protein